MPRDFDGPPFSVAPCDQSVAALYHNVPQLKIFVFYASVNNSKRRASFFRVFRLLSVRPLTSILRHAISQLVLGSQT